MQNILVNGSKEPPPGKAVVLRSGLMAVSTRATGKMVLLPARVALSTRTAMSTTANGRTTKRMDMVYTLIWTELPTRASGAKISSTERDSKLGLMALRTTEHTNMARNTAKVCSPGQMEADTKAISMTIILRVTEFTTGAIREFT